MFSDNEWYQCTVEAFNYVVSPLKETPAFELRCSHPEHGDITGQWWLTDTINAKGIPMWQAAKERCIKLGCNEEELNGPEWIDHARKNVVGKTVACMVEIDRYDVAKAKFIGIPKGDHAGSGYAAVATGAPSPFVNRITRASQPQQSSLDIADDDVPY